MAQCISPYTKKTGETFPCGKCIDCQKRHISGWSFRLAQQAEVSTSALFVTLTYDSENIPISPNGFMTLSKSDLQNFMKRLRKLHEKKSKQYYYKDEQKWKIKCRPTLKYYAAGEYGARRFRPHYHIILFNSDPVLVEKAWSLDGLPLGGIHIGTVTPASTGYTLKYISKQSMIPQNEIDDRLKEFSLMSKKLGANYISNETIKYHHADILNRMYIPLLDGKKIAMPRYFKDKLYSKWQRDRIAKHMQQIAEEEEKKIHADEEKFMQNELIRMNKGRQHNKETRINPTL